MPPNYNPPSENALQSLQTLLKLFRDPKVLKMYGLFLNSAIAGAIMQGILIIFYSMILRKESI